MNGCGKKSLEHQGLSQIEKQGRQLRKRLRSAGKAQLSGQNEIDGPISSARNLFPHYYLSMQKWGYQEIAGDLFL